MGDGPLGIRGFLPEALLEFVAGFPRLLNLILETVQPLDRTLRQVREVGQFRELRLAILQGFPILPSIQ